MNVDPDTFHRLAGRPPAKKATDADKVVEAIGDLARIMADHKPMPMPKQEPPKVQVTLPAMPPATVTVEAQPPREWVFEVKDNRGNLKYTITAKPKTT